MVPVSQKIKKVGGQRAVKIEQVGTPEQFSGKKYKNRNFHYIIKVQILKSVKKNAINLLKIYLT